MTTAVLMIPPFLQFADSTGKPYAGGFVYTYAAGTTTPLVTYTDATAVTAAANPIVLDSAGRCQIWGVGSYKFVVKDSAGNTVQTTDNIAAYTVPGNSGTPLFDTFSGNGSSTVFTLSQSGGTVAKELLVWIDAGDGKGFNLQSPTAYTVSGTSLTFGSAPANGTNNIYVVAPNILANAAAASAAASAGSATSAAADVVLTHADVVLTHADVVLTHADVVTTGNNVTTTNTNVTTTNTNVSTTNTNVTTTATNAATSTTQAGIATTQAAAAASSRSAADADVVLTHADVVLTHADVVLTHADVVTTGNNAATSTTQAGIATTQATAAAASATSAASLAAGVTDTSTTSLTIGTGSKTFTCSSGKQFAAGQFISAVSAANNANYMHGQVTSYSGTTLVVNVLDVGGSGTKADWNLSISGSQGATGSPGASGSVPIAAAGGTVDAITATPSGITLADMAVCAIVSAGANTLTNPTFAPNSLTAHTMTARGGAALVAGDTGPAGYVMLLEYNLANTRWELLNPAKVTNGDIVNATIDVTTKVTGVLPYANGGTGNGFTKFSGAASSEKTYTLPNASCTILTDNAKVTEAQGGTNQTTYTQGDILYASAANTLSKLGVGTVGQRLGSSGSIPQWESDYIPQNSKSAAYTTVLADAGKHIYHPGADTTARTWTIDSNANVAYPIGTALTFVNDTSAGAITIVITSDTLVMAGTGSTGSRTLAANGIATAIKMTSTRWMISGTGLS